MTTLKNLICAAAICVLAGASAHADILSLDFELNTLTATPGQTVTVRGTVTNLAPSSVDLNSCSVTLPGQFTTDDCGAFFSGTGAPFFLGVGESATFDLFTFTPALNFSGSPGLQPPGSFSVLGTVEVAGYDPDTQNVLVDAPFQVNMVPEPSTFALLALVVPAAFALRRRSRVG